MKKIKRILKWIPEYFLVLATLFYWIESSILNPIAIGLFIILILQLIIKNSIMGLAIAGLFILLNLYMFLALFSECREYPNFNDDAKKLLLFGSVYLGSNLMMATIMVIKYGHQIQNKQGAQIN